MIRVSQFTEALAARISPIAAPTVGSSSAATSRRTPSGAISVSESMEITTSPSESTTACAWACRLPMLAGNRITRFPLRRRNSW
jgi:hypothetical protein